MLYQVGRVCYERFNSAVFIVQNRSEKKGEKRFHYPYDFPIVTMGEMRKMITNKDLFICNPTHSRYSFGSRLPAQTVMYLQGVNTYTNLDQNFDHYVSVSGFVRRHALSKYNVDSHVIHPFVDLDTFNQGLPWEQRNKQILVLAYKKETMRLLRKFMKRYQLKYPLRTVTFKKVENLSQKQLATIMGKHQYYLTLTPIEGFGLPPLEAMASGCAVFGFNGYGGMEYFNTKNSCVSEYRNFGPLVEYLHEIDQNPDVGIPLSKNAVTTAKKFSFAHFKAEWGRYLTDTIFH